MNTSTLTYEQILTSVIDGLLKEGEEDEIKTSARHNPGNRVRIRPYPRRTSL